MRRRGEANREEEEGWKSGEGGGGEGEKERSDLKKREKAADVGKRSKHGEIKSAVRKVRTTEMQQSSA